MNFLNMGPGELALIIVLAILVIGPKRVVEVVRSLGRIAAQMRSLSREFMATIQTELAVTERKASSSGEGETEPGDALPQLGSPNVLGDLSGLRREAQQMMGEIARGVDEIVTGEPDAE